MDFSMNLNDNKAGLSGLDKARINAIIKEASKDSLYSKHQEKRASRTQERIRHQRELISKLSSEEIRQNEVATDRLVEEMEMERDLSRTVVHIDMDAFYAAVEMRDDPSLRDKPMAVGGTSMLSTSNYIARRFGVRAAMAGYIGKKLCPQLVIVPPNFRKYVAVSERVRAILADYDPSYVAIGLDEANLDITEHLRLRNSNCEASGSHERRRYAGRCLCRLPRFEDSTDGKDCSTELCDKCGEEKIVVLDQVDFGNSAEEVTKELRFRIEQETGLTASAGIAVNRMLAKVCTDINKPNGQYFLPAVYETIMDFVRSLPIRKVCGIGNVTESMLKAIGVETCGHLYEKRGLLASIYSPTLSRFFLRVGLGICSTVDESSTDGDSERRSIGVERTFAAVSDCHALTNICRSLCQQVAELLERKGLKAKTVVLKTKTVEFDVKTRATTLDQYTDGFATIFDAASSSLRSEIAASASNGELRLRLMGVRMTSFLHERVGTEKLPEITRYLRQSARCDTSRLSSTGVTASREISTAAETSSAVDVAPTSVSSAGALRIVDDDSPSLESSIVESNLETVPFVVCPICNCKFARISLSAFNGHLDQCLNRKTISTLVKRQDEELFSSGGSRRKKPRTKTIDDYFAPI